MKVNLVVQRRDTKRIIDEDPWTITVHRKGRKADDAETTWSFTARLFPAGGDRIAATGTSAGLSGEHGLSYTLDVLLAEWNATMPKEGDMVECVHQGMSLRKNYVAAHGKPYPYKQEVFLDAKQA